MSRLRRWGFDMRGFRVAGWGGATLTENLLWIELNFVTFQQSDELIFKRRIG
jgi:hypothetical protein